MYNFRETTPFKGYEDNQYPAEAMLIDGQLIEDLIPGYSTLQVGGRELLSQSIEKQTIGKSDGELIQYVSNPSREIVVGYRLATEDNLSFRQAFYKLNGILHGDSHQVSFKDDPSKYWVVTLSDIDEVPKGRNEITSSFTLFVPDGVAYSLKSTTVTPDTDGKITVDYQGTYPAYPIITATMKSDNGLVAFANDNGGYLQFGNPEETDGKYKPMSDRVINLPLITSKSGFTVNSGVQQYPVYGGNGNKNLMVGSFSYNDSGATPVYVDKGDTHWDNGRWVGVGALWHGPSLSIPVPKSSADTNTGGFIWRTRFNWATDVWNMGRVEFTLSSAGKVIANTTVIDDSNANMMYIATYCMGQKARQGTSLNRKDFSDGEYEIRFERTSDGGQIQLTKVGGSSFVVPLNFTNYQGVAIDEITIWTQKFGNQDSAGIKIKSTSFEWLNVKTLVDVPNRWKIGDVVKIDIASRKIYVNDVLDNSLQTVGNQWESFALQLGQTVIQPVASSWATMYDCKLTYREAWL